jgi:HK97 family phage portal protein
MGLIASILGATIDRGLADVPARVRRRGLAATQGQSRTTAGIAAGLKAFEENPWLFASVDLIARTCALVPWKAYRPTKGLAASREQRAGLNQLLQRGGYDAAEIQRLDLKEDDHPVLVLLNSPNPAMDCYTFFYVCWTLYELTGSLAIYKDRDREGNLRGLYPIPRTWVEHWPTTDEPHFRISRLAAPFKADQVGAPLPESDFLVFKRATARDPYGEGFGLAHSVGAEVDIDEYASKFLGSYFRNSAQPSLLIGIDGADDSEIERARMIWDSKLRGSHNAHRVHFYSGDLTVHPISSTLKDADMIEVRRFERNTLIQVNSIPPECLGIIENSNRSTIDAADYHLRKNVIAPRMAALTSALQRGLMSEFEGLEGMLLAPVNPIPEDQQHTLEVMRSAPQAFTVNEWRAAAGHGPKPDGDTPYVETTYQSGYSDEEPGSGDGGDKPKGDKAPGAGAKGGGAKRGM